MTIGIMAAMPEEIQRLLAELSGDRTVQEFGQRTYHRGTLWGIPVVLVLARWGKVAAATTATVLITKFEVDEIIFTGVAGAVSPDLGLGDVVIGKQLYQHDMDARPFFEQYEVPLLRATALQTTYAASESLRKAAEVFFNEDFEAVKVVAEGHGIQLSRPKIVEGDIASGDKFFAEKTAILALRKRLPSVTCVEMEGAAVAQVCHEYQLPFSIVRIISDNGDEDAPVDFVSFIKYVASEYSHGIILRLLREHT